MAANESFEALRVDGSKQKETDREKLQLRAQNSHHQQDEEEGNEDKQTDDEMHSDEFQLVRRPQGGAQLRESKLETLGVKSSGSFQSPGLPVRPTTVESTEGVQSKDENGASGKEPMAIVGIEVYEAQTKSQVQMSASPTTLPELSQTSPTHSLSSAPSPIIKDHSLSPKGSSFHMVKSNQENHFNGKKITPISVRKSSTSDGYNWRKYGQKQVKSPTGSRSYYRCTHSDCSAKKIECCNHLGYVVEMVYRSHHSHDPPKKVNPSKESKLTPCSLPLVENSIVDSVRMHDDIDPSISSKEPVHRTPSISEIKQKKSCSRMDNEAKVKEEHVNKQEPRKRLEKEELKYADSHLKPGKKPKFVVRAMGNVAISGDGYRWRKYGQKMVKGNPNARNYYRCTSAGCPVRKHIETAVENTSAIVITYKGVHDHDMPVPKKRHGPPGTPRVAATASTASMNSLQTKKVETLQNQISSTLRPVDKEGELTSQAMDLGGEKAMESARTLLSIGFEIKPC